MANKNLFQTVRGLFTPKTDTINEAGGTAYKLTPKHALAQYAATGCFSNTFYADASEQLDKVLALAKDLDAEFVRVGQYFLRKCDRTARAHLPSGFPAAIESEQHLQLPFELSPQCLGHSARTKMLFPSLDEFVLLTAAHLHPAETALILPFRPID